jgi:hypothetical protein
VVKRRIRAIVFRKLRALNNFHADAVQYGLLSDSCQIERQIECATLGARSGIVRSVDCIVDVSYHVDFWCRS